MVKSSKSLYNAQQKACKSAPGYTITPWGEVFGRRGHALTIYMSGSGYLFVSTIYGARYIHRLLAEAFIPLEDDSSDYIVRHKDGNKINNVIENLEWVKR